MIRRSGRDWTPAGLTACIWLCALPLVFLAVVPWYGVRAAIVTAAVLLPIVALASWALTSRSRVPRPPSSGTLGG
jgi:hypothetical protein